MLAGWLVSIAHYVRMCRRVRLYCVCCCCCMQLMRIYVYAVVPTLKRDRVVAVTHRVRHHSSNNHLKRQPEYTVCVCCVHMRTQPPHTHTYSRSQWVNCVYRLCFLIICESHRIERCSADKQIIKYGPVCGWHKSGQFFLNFYSMLFSGIIFTLVFDSKSKRPKPFWCGAFNASTIHSIQCWNGFFFYFICFGCSCKIVCVWMSI